MKRKKEMILYKMHKKRSEIGKTYNKKTCQKNIMLFKQTHVADIMENRKGRKKNKNLNRDQYKEEVL